MPRKPKGPRLYLRSRRGRDSVWVILDGKLEVGTGCSEGDFGEAEKVLQRYLVQKHRPEWHRGDPAEVKVADVLIYYGEEHVPSLAHPELVGYHMGPLIEFFGDKMCSYIEPQSCRTYRRGRVAGKIGRRGVKESTAGRELETLQAALNFAFKEKRLALPVLVALPPKAPRRERWLARSEVARLLAGALGIVPIACDIATQQPCKWGRMFKPAYHVARFILIALYTGTRHEAILELRWEPNTAGGWFDLDRGVIYRRGQGEAETNKRRVPAPIPENLFPHVERWRRMTKLGPVEYAGRLIKKERRGFDRARSLGGLGEDVTPHVLKHTCITWMLQRNVPMWEVAGFTGTSERIIREVYGHHSPEHLPTAKRRFHGRTLGART